MFRLQTEPIDGAACRAGIERPEAGACAIFEGWIRNHHHGREVERLEFEAFDTLVRTEGVRMVAEVEARYPGSRVLCVHRTGQLEIGELAVWIGATSPHRAAAFAACRETIEELKRRLPIWKREHFAGGVTEWVDCTQEQNPALRRDEYFARVRKLREVGEEGLTRLAGASVLVIGAGGLGCAAVEALAGSGVGRVTIADDGLVERSNLPRQTLYTEGDLGLPKAPTAAARLHLRNPHVEIVAITRRFAEDAAADLLAGHAVVLDCTDNPASRRLATVVCARVGVPLVQATVFGFEGTLDTYVPPVDGSAAWPDSADAAGMAESPVFSPAAAVLGQLQAGEAIKLLLGLPVPSREQTLLIDLLQCSVTPIAQSALLP